jgi:hypothetical protein
MSGEFTGKKVDESWKDSVQKEKESGPDAPDAAAGPADFLSFLSTLAMQCLITLGDMPHPATQKAETDLAQAQYLIDTIQMLSEKTRGNLTEEEARALEALLYELRMKFVQKKGAVR